MIIPIGHDKTTVRRLPWVTFMIMILCGVVFLVTLPGEQKSQRVAAESIDQAVEFFVERPYLELQPRFFDLLELQVGEEDLNAEIELMRRSGRRPPASVRALQEEQEYLDGLVDVFFQAVDDRPSRIFGWVPASPKLYTLLTYQFMHAGWLHLIFNMIFLFVVGPFIEDVWGRPLYAGFYLTAGIVSAVMFGVRYPDLEMPLIGASGAVAGVMGAFLVRFVKVKMRFILWLGMPLGPFRAPAWVIFPFWFLIQLFSAQIMDVVLPEAGGGGVAFWAHVWGFAFGAIVAAAIVHFRVEERFLNRFIESKITLVDNTAVEDAAQLAEKGKDDAAIASLQRELEGRPDNIDAAMSLWNLCFERGLVETAAPHMVRALERAVRTVDISFVLANWEEVLYSGCQLELDPNLGVRFAEILVEDARHESARDTVELAYRTVGDATPFAILLRLLRLGTTLNVPGSGEIVDLTLSHPDVPFDAREELESLAAKKWESPSSRRSAPHPESDSDESKPVPETLEHTIEVMSAVPCGVAGNFLELKVRGKGQRLDLGTIQALAVCGISRSGQKPVVVVDLLLDSPWGTRPAIRTVRLTSNTFDPCSLVGGKTPLEAFQKLLQQILKSSQAVPLPDPDAAIGQPFRSFPSINAYQKEVLGVVS